MIDSNFSDATLINYTRLFNEGNNTLLDEYAGTEQDFLIEFSARLCYRSEDKMRQSPNFISLRIREGHLDVTEHVCFTFLVSYDPEPRWNDYKELMFISSLPTANVSWLHPVKTTEAVITMNIVNIRHLLQSEYQNSPLARKAFILVGKYSPQSFTYVNGGEDNG